jgi:hypothetical protein
VTLTDTNGDLSVTGSGGTVTGSGSNDLVISGTLAEVNSYLGTLSDTDSTAGSDNLTLNATDSLGHTATSQAIDVTVNPEAPATSSTIATGGSLEIASSSNQDVTFQGSTGSLTLDSPSSFTGHISGFTGDGTLAGSDQIDLKGINYTSTSFSESYDPTTDTLSVSDGTNGATLHFIGTYQAANFSFQSDGSGGTIVYDPPVSNSSGPEATHPPGSTTDNTIVATLPNETLTGSGGNNSFVFSFAAIGHDTVTNFNPDTDVLQFSNAQFANLKAILDSAQNDGHGNTVINVDAHDTVTLSNVVKSQLHTTDFHIA